MKTAASTHSPRKIAAVVAGTVGLALAIAFATTGYESGASPDEAYGDPVIVGAILPIWDGGPGDPTVGSSAPIAVGIGVDGTAVEVGGAGRPQLIAFLAHWCSHCNAEVPVVVDWVASGGLDDGVDLVAVATATDAGLPNFPPTTWLTQRSWPAPAMLDDRTNSVGMAYGVSGYPFWVVLDADGHVVLRTSGELSVPQLDALVALALGE